MRHFYLQHPPSHKQFDPWDVEHLLSLSESWAPASSLTTFKLAWKTATFLALVTAKHCSDLTLLCVDNQHLFLQRNAAIFVPLSGGKTDRPGHLPPQICIESHSSVNLCPVFYLKAYLRHTESFWKKPDGSRVTSLFLGNNRQHRPVCAKTISSWVRKVLGVAKAHMSLGSLWGVAACAALAAGVSLVTILQAGDWTRVSMPARHYFSTYITMMDRHQDSVQACRAGPQWVGPLWVSVKHWLILSLAYVGLLGRSSPQYRADSSPIVCAVLALDSWNYCSGEQAQQPNTFFSMFAMHGFID